MTSQNEMHVADDNQLKTRGNISSFTVVGYTLHPTYSLTTYSRNGLKNKQLISTHTDNNVHAIVIAIDQLKIVNV